MRTIVTATALTLTAMLLGCGKGQPLPTEAEQVPKADEQANDSGSTPASGDPPSKGITALFPSASRGPKRDDYWEKTTSNLWNMEVRVVSSSALGLNFQVTAFPAVQTPEAYEKDPGAALEREFVIGTKGYSMRVLTQDGKFPARQITIPGAAGSKEVLRYVYAHKRLYKLKVSGFFLKSDEDVNVLKFLDSLAPKP
jgi:hypothetical protein